MDKLMPVGFKRFESGVFFIKDDDSDEPPVFVCSPSLYVLCRSVDEMEKWGLLVEFSDHAGSVIRLNLTANMLRNPAKLSIKLDESGLQIGEEPNLLARFIRGHNPTKLVREAPKKTPEQLVIESVAAFAIKHQKRFHRVGDFTPLDRAGFLADDEICFTAESLRLASGVTATRTAKILLKAGLLMKNDDHLAKKVNTGAGKIRLYAVHNSVLEYDPPTLLTPALKPETPVLEQKPRFDPDFENAETRINNGLPPKTPLLCEPLESNENDSTNFLVTSFNDGIAINSSYQPTPAELDFLMTIREYDSQEDGNDDRETALTAFLTEEGLLEDSCSS